MIPDEDKASSSHPTWPQNSKEKLPQLDNSLSNWKKDKLFTKMKIIYEFFLHYKTKCSIKITTNQSVNVKFPTYLLFVDKKVVIWWQRNEYETIFSTADAILREKKVVSAIENNSTKYLSKYILAVLAQFLVCQTFDTMVGFGKKQTFYIWVPFLHFQVV